MARKTIRNQILQLTLLPTLFIALVLGGGLTTLYIHQLEAIPAQRGAAASEQLAALAAVALQTGNTAALQPMANAVLEEAGVKAVQILNATRQPVAFAGPRIRLPAVNETLSFDRKSMHIQSRRALYFIAPLRVADAPPIGWVVLEVNAAATTLKQYQGVVIALGCALATLVFAALLTLRLNRSLSAPLERLKWGIAQLADGNLHTRIDIDRNNEFSDLADAVNKMAVMLQQSQREMQHHIDQSTDDLRETLETIEIQNIELDLARKEALAASRIKSEFLANTSHEIRTPLNGIIGFTNLLLKSALTPQQRQHLLTIESSSQGLLTIINDIIDFSRLETGKLTLDYTPLHLRQVIEQTLNILAPAAHEKQLQLIALIDPQVPLHLLGDPPRLRQILTNLVSNAIKFSSQGNVVVRVIIEHRDASHTTLKISVSDSGIGLSSEQQAALFRAFSQADASSARRHGGTGLGLAISKGLAERMGGSIGVESEPGRGATFWFTVNLGIDDAPAERDGFAALSGQRIAIFDSNTLSRLQLNQYLQSWQVATLELTTFHNILPAAKRAKKADQRIHALVLDTLVENGTPIAPEALRSLINQLEQHFHCKTVLLASNHAQRKISEAIASTSAVVVNKPVCHDRLYQALCAQLGVSVETEASSLSPSRIAALTDGRKPNILVVDDNRANLTLTGEMLTDLNVEVTLVSSGAEALERLEQQTFDLIFMDIQMPGMDGLETTQRIRSRERPDRRTPVVALTAHALSEQRSQLLLAGLDDYLSKPTTEAQLAQVINRWVRGAQVPVTGSGAEQNTTTTDEDKRMDFDAANENVRPLVDIAESLRMTHDKADLARDMLRMLINSLDTTAASISQAYQASNFVQLQGYVHQLYGGCCYCGVPRLREVCGGLDKQLQRKEYADVTGQVERLLGEIAKLQSWAEEHDLDAVFGCDADLASQP